MIAVGKPPMTETTTHRFSFGPMKLLAEIEYEIEDGKIVDDSIHVIVITMMVFDPMNRCAYIDMTGSDVVDVAECFAERIEKRYRDRLRTICLEHWERQK